MIPTTALAPERERGQSLITSVAAIAVFLGFLMFAVHICVNLYADTTVTATAYDAARRVARAELADGNREAATVAAEADLKENLGRYSSRIRDIDWDITADVVALHIVVENPSFLIFSDADLGVGEIDKTVRVRVEKVR
ncbi:MAG TPA: hypothetical protein VGO60_05795 [Iamia sp.]|jgi:YD repeat-containing protein|nr:hypothetical protein [Iamia sp.]